MAGVVGHPVSEKGSKVEALQRYSREYGKQTELACFSQEDLDGEHEVVIHGKARYSKRVTFAGRT